MKKIKISFKCLRVVKWWKWLILGLFTLFLIIWFCWVNSEIAMNLIKDMGNIEINDVQYSYHMLYVISTFTMVRWSLYACLCSLIYGMFKSIISDLKGANINE